MTRLFAHRPSPSMVVALAALLVALSGTALAATKLVNGDKLIRKGSLSGNRLRRHTITGRQVNLGQLGKVPSSSHADSAANAGNASHANVAGALGIMSYRSSAFSVPATSRATGAVACPVGTVATGGGTTSPNEGAYLTDYLIDSYPASNRAGWRATVENED